MSITAIIPARGGSKRIPLKNIMSINGKPLIVYSIEQALQSKLVDRVVVSTDDGEIAHISKEHGAEVIKRTLKLATDTATSESALIHVLDELDKHGESPDYIVFLQCTSPIRKDGDIDKAIMTIKESGADSLFSAYRFDKYIWRINDGLPVSINFDYKKERWREQDFPTQYQENGSIYVIKPWVLRKNNSRFGGKLAVYEMDCLDSFQIDTQEDIYMCECILRMKSKQGSIK